MLTDCADLVGANCGTGVDDMVEIARALTRMARRPVFVQPNAGLPETRGGVVSYGETPEMLASRVPELLDLGVRLVGGCCGTTPEHTRAVRDAVDGWRGGHAG